MVGRLVTHSFSLSSFCFYLTTCLRLSCNTWACRWRRVRRRHIETQSSASCFSAQRDNRSAIPLASFTGEQVRLLCPFPKSQVLLRCTSLFAHCISTPFHFCQSGSHTHPPMLALFIYPLFLTLLFNHAYLQHTLKLDRREQINWSWWPLTLTFSIFFPFFLGELVSRDRQATGVGCI